MKLANYSTSDDSGSDIGETTVSESSPSKDTIALQSSCRPKRKYESNDYSTEKNPAFSTVSEVISEIFGFSVEASTPVSGRTKSRDIPSPPKRRRKQRWIEQEGSLELLATRDFKNLAFRNDAKTEDRNMDEDDERICGGARHNWVNGMREGKGEDPFLNYLAYCKGLGVQSEPENGPKEPNTMNASSKNAGEKDHGNENVAGYLNLTTRSARLDEALRRVQRRRERSETILKTLKWWDGEVETATDEDNEEAGLIAASASNVGFSDDRCGSRGSTLVEEYEVVTPEDTGYQNTARSSISTEELFTSRGSLSTTASPLASGSTDEDAMEQQAGIQSHQIQHEMSKGCSGASSNGCGTNNEPKFVIVEDIEETSPRGQHNADHEKLDLSSSEFSYDRSEEDLECYTRIDKGESTRITAEMVESVKNIMVDTLCATAEELTNGFIKMFHKECSVSTEGETTWYDGVEEEIVEAVAKRVRCAFMHLKEDCNGALKKAENISPSCPKPKISARHSIFTNWDTAYPDNVMRPSELMRAVRVLISLTNPTPHCRAILENTPGSEYDALAVHIQHYLQIGAAVTCEEIMEGSACACCEREVGRGRMEMPCFVPWWKRIRKERMKKLEERWEKGVLSRKFLDSVKAAGGSWN
ncbi:hypothetical protein SBOR_7125 [Sclerotinia borealis F-4128]|uniref:Uncharacterized protein n=1 Tax=Sclerotinia borealis (strain F-4128) TaxID=1432307 RepID=W9C6S5_SCLBF|nr:hypothetical protein SBOR_7125 [Sclerotinia borealis F-4128]